MTNETAQPTNVGSNDGLGVVPERAVRGPCSYLRKMDCPNMLEREGDTSMSYEHYDCKVCGAHVALDYDEMR